MLLILGTGLFLALTGRMFFMQSPMVASPEMVRATQAVENQSLRPVRQQ